MANEIFSSFLDNDNKKLEIALHKLLIIYNKCLRRIKYKYFFKYNYIVIKLRFEDYQNFCNKRNNKLYIDYKVKQMMINELQKRFFFEEGEKYTFYPIINNYIIKCNRPYFPTLTGSEKKKKKTP